MEHSIEIKGSGCVYENSSPFLGSIVAYHPSLSWLGGSELLATFDIGEAVEAFDYHTVAARSRDQGETWELEGPIVKEPPLLTTHTVRTSRLRNGSMVGFGGFFRRKQGAGVVNRQTLGLVPVDLFIVRSTDGGHTWTKPRTLTPPLKGPSWEICHAIVETESGRWLAPTSTWRGWDESDYPGDQAVVLMSGDQGASWSSYGVTFDGRKNRLSYLEQSVVNLGDRALLAVSWACDSRTGKTEPSVYSISRDDGATFSPPRFTDFYAQTCKVSRLIDGRLLCVYRRNDRDGLWATVSQLHDDEWVNLFEAPLWLGADSGMKGVLNTADELSNLKFGHPSIRQISSHEVLILFWYQEYCITKIRWIKLRVV
jgi:BNR repeat-like domain